MFHHEDTQTALKQLFANLLKDPETQAFLSQSLKEVATAALNDEEFYRFLVTYIRQLLDDEQVQESLIQLAVAIFHHKVVLHQASEFARDVLATDTVQQQGVKLGQYVASGEALSLKPTELLCYYRYLLACQFSFERKSYLPK